MTVALAWAIHNVTTESYDVTLEHRCQNGVGCSEVVDRLLAADRSEAAGFHEVAEQLRETAATYADLHHHGATSDGAG